MQLNLATGLVSIVQTILIIGLSALLSLVIAYVYKLTHRGLSYSQSFIVTLVLLGVIVSVIMYVIGNSLATAVGLFGAFSIIRFRTVVKDTRDTAYVFFVLAIGMAIGTGNYLIALVATVAICALIYLLYFTNFGSLKKFGYVVSFLVDATQEKQKIFESVFEKYLRRSSLLNVKAKDKGKFLAFTFNIEFQKGADSGEFTRDLNKLHGLSEVSLLSSKNDIEF